MLTGNNNFLDKLRAIIRQKLLSEVESVKTTFDKYDLKPNQTTEVNFHILNAIRTGRSTFKFNDFDTTDYAKFKPMINSIMDYLAVNYHTTKGKTKQNIYDFLFSSLVPTNSQGELNAIGKITYTVLRNQIPTHQNELNEDYEDENLDDFREVYFDSSQGFNKALAAYKTQTSSFISFLIKVLSQNLIDVYRKKSYTKNGERIPFKTHSLDNFIDLNTLSKNHRLNKKTSATEYDKPIKTVFRFADAIIDTAFDESQSDANWLDKVDLSELRNTVINFIVDKLQKHDKIAMLKLFRQMYVLGIKDQDEIAKNLGMSKVNVRVSKIRFENFITSFVKSGEFQKYIKHKMGVDAKFPNDEFRTNKAHLAEEDNSN